MFELTKEAVVARGIIKEITGYDMDAIEILEDSSSCIRGCTDYMNASLSRKMKHERLVFHSLMWYIKNEIILLTQTPSIDQPMDLLTKPLPNKLHWKHIGSIQGESEELELARQRAIKSFVGMSTVYQNLEIIDKNCTTFNNENEITIANTRYNSLKTEHLLLANDMKGTSSSTTQRNVSFNLMDLD